MKASLPQPIEPRHARNGSATGDMIRNDVNFARDREGYMFERLLDLYVFAMEYEVPVLQASRHARIPTIHRRGHRRYPTLPSSLTP